MKHFLPCRCFWPVRYRDSHWSGQHTACCWSSPFPGFLGLLFSVSPLQAYSQGSQLLLTLIQKTLFVLLASHPPTFTLTASTKVLDSTNSPSRFFFNRICHLWNTILALNSVILRFIVYFFHGEINSTQAFLEA